jgi:murein DD-endopeptidase MepM/ murein hydrolase activator NlpD
MRAGTTASPSAAPHAACTIRSGYVAPVAGPLVVVTAFGELVVNAGVRSATQGVDLATTIGKPVRAAQSGRLVFMQNYRGYAKSAILTAKGGAQTFYAPLYGHTFPKARTVKAGQVFAASGAATLHFEITGDAGLAGGATSQLNPCGLSDGATGTISVLPASPNVSAYFSTFSLDGSPVPSASPFGVVTMTAAAVVPPHTWAYGGVVEPFATGNYYIVLCGNVVFQTGPARFSQLIQFSTTGNPAKLPKLIFFRDPGTQGASLTQDLPVYGNPCPAPAPVSGSFSSWVFNENGQTASGLYWISGDGGSGETMLMSSNDTSVVTVAPASVPIYQTAPPSSPAPSNTFTITATGVGSATITNTNKVSGATAAPISVIVHATPSPAPVPTPLPNTMPSSTPTAAPTASPTPTASPSPTASPTP